ncbi:hypothetical protein CDAR_61481 [Caerostris darwini]|uniref:Uncharacterized protein n=1 Tax=Caerostris darwini TaxID=1538125 RepID=A0AAV4UJI7_9ARAC|nr:hypothetical protein CDAR_61481 [Caerostris darwini]
MGSVGFDIHAKLCSVGNLKVHLRAAILFNCYYERNSFYCTGENTGKSEFSNCLCLFLPNYENPVSDSIFDAGVQYSSTSRNSRPLEAQRENFAIGKKKKTYFGAQSAKRNMKCPFASDQANDRVLNFCKHNEDEIDWIQNPCKTLSVGNLKAIQQPFC